MAWLDVEWSNGDYLTEAKLDTMQANADHVREEVNNHNICPIMWYEGDQVMGNDSITLDIKIDTTPVGSQQSGVGAKHEADLDYQGLASRSHASLEIVEALTELDENDPRIQVEGSVPLYMYRKG